MFLQDIMKKIPRPKKLMYIESKLIQNIIDYDENSLYLYCSGDAMACGKNRLVSCE